MIIEIEDTSAENIQLILNFAQNLKLKATFIDDSPTGSYTKKYTGEELNTLIEKNRSGVTIGIDDAHQRIKTLFKWK